LAFAEPDLENSFVEEHNTAAHAHYRRIVPLGVVIFALTGVFDATMSYHGASARLSIRYLVAVPLLFCVLAFGWSPWRLFLRGFQWAIASGLVIIAASVSAMMMVSDSAIDRYAVTSVGLVILAGHTVAMLRHLAALLTGIVCTICYLIAAAFTSSHVEVALSFFYLSIANVLGFLGSRLIETYRRRDFLQRRGLEFERARSEALLRNMLPEAIAERLKGRPDDAYIAEHFPKVTVLFGDIVGFTRLAESLKPQELVAALNELFSAFDDLAGKHGLEKIKTIGDAYMVVGGLPIPREGHVRAVAEMALEMHDLLDKSSFAHDRRLSMRIGIHTGPAVAGVIGKRKFIYDLWGDTVNTASRMESHGVARRVQISEEVATALGDEFDIERRGEIEIKGKGLMTTYWLNAKRP
jgi:class 3 adenylate cyclase